MSKSNTFTKPNINDVKPGGGSHKHPGNRHYSDLVSKKKVAFVMARHDTRKRDEIVRSIYDSMLGMSPPGRFLEKNADGSYSIKDREKALIKIKTALSENNSKIIEHLQMRGKLKPPVKPPDSHRKPGKAEITKKDWEKVIEMLK